MSDPQPMSPYEQARAAFDSYCTMDDPFYPPHPLAALQVKLYRWQVKKFPHHDLPTSTEMTLGQAEEFGELCEALSILMLLKMGSNAGRLCHLELKESHRIRGIDFQSVRPLAADALADQFIFMLQLCTARRLDAWTLIAATAEKVMKRNWIERPLDAHEG